MSLKRHAKALRTWLRACPLLPVKGETHIVLDCFFEDYSIDIQTTWLPVLITGPSGFEYTKTERTVTFSGKLRPPTEGEEPQVRVYLPPDKPKSRRLAFDVERSRHAYH